MNAPSPEGEGFADDPLEVGRFRLKPAEGVRLKQAQAEGFGGPPFWASSPSTRKLPSSLCAWSAMYAVMTSSVTLPLLQQK